LKPTKYNHTQRRILMKFKCRLGIVLPALMAGVVMFGSTLLGNAHGATFPEKGRPITLIMPSPAGGSSDTSTRLLLPLLEKELGTPVQIVNRPGAGLQLGTTEFTRSRPDGYTLGYVVLPTVVTTYLDPTREASFSRKSFEPLALLDNDPGVIAVKGNSPYKTLKDIIDAAKANPGKIRTTTSGILSDDHIAAMETERAAGVRFSIVHFDGAAPGRNAVLGGHIEVYYGNVADVYAMTASGEIRVVAVLGRKRSNFYPNVKTAEEQGYKIFSAGTYRGFVLPGGTPKEVQGVMIEALKKVITSDEYRTQMEKIGFAPLYMDPQAFASLWTQYEVQAKKWLEWVKEKK
jgi:tripartite-type tricarboxylate transporter receptor subunit TctC